KRIVRFKRRRGYDIQGGLGCRRVPSRAERPGPGARQAALAEHHAVLRQGHVEGRGGESRRGGEVGGGLRDPQAPGHVQIHVAVESGRASCRGRGPRGGGGGGRDNTDGGG